MSRPRVLFIAGTGRSGSTVVARFVEHALDAFHTGELRYLWSRGLAGDQLCECRAPFNECPFWSTVLTSAFPAGVTPVRHKMERLNPQVDRMRWIPANAWGAARSRPRRSVRAYADVLTPLYRAVAETSGAGVVIDSSKDPSYLFALHAADAVDLHVLHLVRDSRAVAHSWTRRKARPEVHWEQQFMQVLPPSVSARRWMEYHLAVESYRRLGKRITRVRYEDFAADPAQCVSHVLGDAGYARSSGLPLAGRHSFSGNPMRFETAPMRVRIDSAWTTEMSAADRRRVSALTFPLLKHYGYPAW